MPNKNKSSEHWAQKKERGSLFGLIFITSIFKIFGSGFCKVVMTPVLLYFYLFNSSARKNIGHFFTNISQQADIDISPSQWNRLKVIFNFGYGVIDKLSAWSGRMPLEKLNSIDDEDFRSYEKQGKGAILLVSHLGNHEICRVASEQRSPAKFNIFMHTKNSKKITQVIESLNPKYTISIIQGDELNMQLVMELKDKIDDGEFIVIAGDRVPVEKSNGTIEMNFLGEMARFPIGPFVLAKVLSCPIITLYCLKNKNKYDVYFDLLIEELNFNRKNRDEVLQLAVGKYIESLEKYSKKAPLQWYNFHQFWTKKS